MAKKVSEQQLLEDSLRKTRRQIARLRNDIRKQDRQVPASSKHLEDRLEALEKNVREARATEKQMAYKLKRVAESKMVSETAEKMQDPAVDAPAFNCLDGLERCLERQRTGWGKALCYVLFVRCIIGG